MGWLAAAAGTCVPVVAYRPAIGTGVCEGCGVCGRDGFGVLGPRGVKGLADGFRVEGFLTTGVVPLGAPATELVPLVTVAVLLDALAAGVDFSDPAPALTIAADVGVLTMPVGVVVLLLGAGEASGLGVDTGRGCCGGGGACSSNTGEARTTGEVCGGGIAW